MSALRQIAQLMVRMGLILLTLAILLRLVSTSASSAIANDLAIGASLLVTLSAAAYLRFGR